MTRRVGKGVTGLDGEDAIAWAKLVASVTPMYGRVPSRRCHDQPSAVGGETETRGKAVIRGAPKKGKQRGSSGQAPSPVVQKSRLRGAGGGLDSSWERRLRSGRAGIDFTLDLHGLNLDQAYQRLMNGLDQARALNARVILLVVGKERPAPAADRGARRGAIRAKLLDWLSASRHASSIAAVRSAHQRHGGSGALYLILRRRG